MAEYPYDPPSPTGGPLTPTPAPTPAGGRAGDTIEEVTTTIRDFVNKVPETINKAIERALNVRDTTVLVRLSEATSDGLDTLVSAGIFKTRSEAAAFLVDEGIKTQGALFQSIREKLTEIERLRAELRHSVSPEIHRP